MLTIIDHSDVISSFQLIRKFLTKDCMRVYGITKDWMKVYGTINHSYLRVLERNIYLLDDSTMGSSKH